MTIHKMLEMLAIGTPNGSALKELAEYYVVRIMTYHLSVMLWQTDGLKEKKQQ